MIERGVIYMCWGDPATRKAENSMRSLWKNAPEIPVMVVGDKAAVKYFTLLGADANADSAFVTFLINQNPDSNIMEHFVGRPRVLTHLCSVDPFTSQTAFGFKAGKIKPLLAEISPFEKTLYVDAETEFKISPEIGFNLLEKWDMVIAEAETRSLGTTFPGNHLEADKTAAWLKTPHILYHNSGMFFWRKNEATLKLFNLWSEEWLKYKGWDEQVALLRALLRSNVLFLNVPFTWNCRGPKGAYLLYHDFASQSARKYKCGGHAYTSRHTGPSNIPARPLVRVELAPGRFVRCHEGDEAKVKEYFGRMSGMARRKVKAV